MRTTAGLCQHPVHGTVGVLIGRPRPHHVGVKNGDQSFGVLVVPGTFLAIYDPLNGGARFGVTHSPRSDQGVDCNVGDSGWVSFATASMESMRERMSASLSSTIFRFCPQTNFLIASLSSSLDKPRSRSMSSGG